MRQGLKNGSVCYYLVTALGPTGAIGNSGEEAATPEDPKINLALRTQVTCSSSEREDRGPTFAVDGDKATRWSSA